MNFEDIAMREFEKADHWDAAAKHYQKTAHPFTAHFAEAAHGSH